MRWPRRRLREQGHAGGWLAQRLCRRIPGPTPSTPSTGEQRGAPWMPMTRKRGETGRPPHEAPDPGALPGKARDPLPRRPPNHPAPMPAPRPAPMPGPAPSPMPGATPQNQYKRITANRRAPAPSIPRPSPPGACPPAKAHPMASPAQRAEPPAPAPRSARSPGLRRADRHPGAPAPPPGPPAAVAAAAAAPARRPSPQPPAPPGPRPPTAQSHRTAGCARAA